MPECWLKGTLKVGSAFLSSEAQDTMTASSCWACALHVGTSGVVPLQELPLLQGTRAVRVCYFSVARVEFWASSPSCWVLPVCSYFSSHLKAATVWQRTLPALPIDKPRGDPHEACLDVTSPQVAPVTSEGSSQCPVEVTGARCSCLRPPLSRFLS